MDRSLRGDDAKELAEQLIRSYFKTQDYPYTRHHIESYDQFLSQDLPAIIKAENPFIMLQDPQRGSDVYGLKAEIYIGGFEGDRIFIGTPTVSLKDGEEIRVLFPNEARLRNLTYSSMIEADIAIRLTITRPDMTTGRFTSDTLEMDPAKDPVNYGYLAKFPLVRMPIMLHSRYCILHGKPQSFLHEAGECVYDHGGYFVVDGSEKVLITRQEQAFNTLYIAKQDNDPKLAIYASMTCLNPVTRQVKRVAFLWNRQKNTLEVNIPFVRKALPVFVLFRAMGLQADEDILRAILPDPESAETKILEPLLLESILDAYPFLDTYSSIQYVKTMTKGFSEAHVLNVLHNQVFIHVEDRPNARITFLAECVRQILRVFAGIDSPTDKDDIRNQRCLTSGVLTRMLFQGAYKSWKKAMILTLDKEYKYNTGLYRDTQFANLFQQGTLSQMFKAGMLTEGILRGFKGKWGSGMGEEKTGVLQPLSRLSYLDFMSHCRRVVLDFDTGLKMAGPRRLHPSQFGYFCTNETPGGASIGITKNLSTLTSISTASEPGPLIRWLTTRGQVMACDQITAETHSVAVPVFVNAGIIGYSMRPQMLTGILKLMKWTGCLPASTSISFNIRGRRVLIYMDEGRPLRPLIHLDKDGVIPLEKLTNLRSWRDLILGQLPFTRTRGLHQVGFVDPLVGSDAPTFEDYVKTLAPYTGAIEYVDPYESNEAYVAMYPEYIQAESSHLEIHPSTIVGLLTSMIPFPNHNQSPRNQLSCSQSKQGLSVYSTHYPNRFDNQVHVLCYGEAPIVRTLYYDYLADGQMPYGQNLVVAIASFTGYNQDDGILFNADSFQRGMFRSICYRSYEIFEEDDTKLKTRTKIGNPARVPSWTSLKAGLDYSKLDERGIIRVGEYVDETTVLVGMYLQSGNGEMRDASKTAQVWTRGRVDAITVTTSNTGMALVKVRVVQERIPELGDKFSTRHGQKGTMGMLLRAHDMPRTATGLVPDMIVNPHCMPSRMTMAQLLESLLGKAASNLGAIGNATAFMNDGNPTEQIGAVLRDQLGLDPAGDELLYDGMSGQMIPSTIFMGPIYIMRLKHMPEDKWNARAEGRKEQRTHQPTGGRGNQGGLRIGEMERDAILGHGVMDFVRESYMKRADSYQTIVCNGCGTIPIYNESKRLYLCPLCDGPAKFIGSYASNLELLPANKRSLTTFSKVEIPYATKLLDQELNFFLNMGMRILTDKDVRRLRGAPLVELTAEQQKAALEAPLPERKYPDLEVPEVLEQKEEMMVRPEDLSALGLSAEEEEAEAESGKPLPKVNTKVLNAAVEAAVNATLKNSNAGTPRMAAAAVNAAVNAAVAAANSVKTPAGEEDEKGTAAAAASANAPSQVLSFTPMQQQQPQQSLLSDEMPLEDGDFDELPGSQQQQQAPLMSGGGVNVQTKTQPVLVVPLNVAGQQGGAPPAQMISSGIPGAPPTFAVDTSEMAMNQSGLAMNSSSSSSRRSGRSNSVSSNSSQKVSVNKLGGDSGASTNTSASNVKVSVNKLG
jgi:DNA-directed RNA polymerase II subunit RPB2